MPIVTNPAQEVLFPINIATGEVIEPPSTQEGSNEEVAISLINRNVHLLNTLRLLSVASIQTGYVMHARTEDGRADIAQRYGSGAGVVTSRVETRRESILQNAKWEFARATGLFVLADSGLYEKADVKASTKADYSRFLNEYGVGSHKHLARTELRDRLVESLEEMRQRVSSQNRKTGNRPHAKKAQIPEKMPETQYRLKAIYDDPRAGFLPTTHKEKTQVIAFLDYLDNPEYPLGINNQMNEIFSRAQTVSRTNKPGDRTALRGKAAGERALESIAYEIGDYYNSATGQEELLRRLEEVIVNCPNPNVLLVEQVAAEHGESEANSHELFAPLVQYLDLMQLKVEGKTNGIKNPLYVRINRWAEGSAPGKHKIIEDKYTAQVVDSDTQKYIMKRAGELTVGDLRSVINDAVANQVKRHTFMEACLVDFGQVKEKVGLNITSKAAQLILSNSVI